MVVVAGTNELGVNLHIATTPMSALYDGICDLWGIRLYPLGKCHLIGCISPKNAIRESGSRLESAENRPTVYRYISGDRAVDDDRPGIVGIDPTAVVIGFVSDNHAVSYGWRGAGAQVDRPAVTIVAAAHDTIVYHNTIGDRGCAVNAVNCPAVVSPSPVGDGESG